MLPRVESNRHSYIAGNRQTAIIGGGGSCATFGGAAESDAWAQTEKGSKSVHVVGGTREREDYQMPCLCLEARRACRSSPAVQRHAELKPADSAATPPPLPSA